MSELTLQSFEHGRDKLHENVNYTLMIRHAKAIKWLADRAIGLRNRNWKRPSGSICGLEQWPRSA